MSTVMLGFGVLAPLLAVAFVVAVAWSAKREGLPNRAVVRTAIGVVLWLAITFGLAASGALAFGPMPPRVPILFALTLALTIFVARSNVGRALASALPFSILIGFQVFRVLVEILLHRAASDGLAPPQMTWSGLNFDVVTGASSILVAWLALQGRASPALIAAWNAIGALLLANVLVIAILSMPTPLRMFWNEPVNTWIARAPFVWLPTVLVPMAILGHLLVWQKLRALRQSSQRLPLST